MLSAAEARHMPCSQQGTLWPHSWAPLQAQSPAWWVGWWGFPAKFREELTPPAPPALPPMLIWTVEKLQVSGGAGTLTGTPQPPTPPRRLVAGFPLALVVAEEERGRVLCGEQVGVALGASMQLSPYRSRPALFCVAEFDKFLEERAKAAEMVPNLPSPPAEAPAPASNPSSRKKPEQSEDALFAL